MNRKMIVSCAALAALSGAASAQLSENFDGYTAGSTIAGQGGWEVWYSGGTDATVSTAQAHSGANSLFIVPGSDIVHRFAITGGKWTLTAWVYSPFGKNFVKTILTHAGKGTDLKVVNDQIGSPTYAPHLVEAILGIARKLAAPGGAAAGPWGIYHAAGSGEASWYEVAREILHRSAELGGPTTSLSAIGTDGYPTRAARPRNSRLDCSKLQRVFAITQPDWRDGVSLCVARLLTPHA